MLMTEIKRTTMTFPCASDESVALLANEAEEVLGYGLLKRSLDDAPEAPRLAKVLSELGIEILNKQDVLTYMRERLNDRTLELLDEWQKTGAAAIGPWGYGESFSGPSWVATTVDKYREAIPEFVVNKAVQIKRALPEAEIFIRHLTEDKDPFLEVTLGKANDWDAEKNGSERYFVEVWEEPKFEGRLR